MDRLNPWRLAVLPLIAGTVLCSGLSGQQDASPTLFNLRGEVRDYATELPIQGAVVQIAELALSQVTDANGYFEFAELPAGEHTFITASFGYETNEEESAVGPGNIMLVRLSPIPIEIPGVSVEAERLMAQLETRRIMTASPTTVFAEAQLAQGLPTNLTRLVAERAPPIDMFTNPNDQLCIVITPGSSPVRLKVFLDEAPVASAFLDNLQSTDVALMEVYSRLGMVRVYTYDFIQRASDVGYVPAPINLVDRTDPC